MIFLNAGKPNVGMFLHGSSKQLLSERILSLIISIAADTSVILNGTSLLSIDNENGFLKNTT